MSIAAILKQTYGDTFETWKSRLQNCIDTGEPILKIFSPKVPIGSVNHRFSTKSHLLFNPTCMLIINGDILFAADYHITMERGRITEEDQLSPVALVTRDASLLELPLLQWYQYDRLPDSVYAKNTGFTGKQTS